MNALMLTNQILRLRNVLTNKISRLVTWSLTKDHPSFHSSPMWCLSDVKSCNKMYIALYHKIKILHSSWTKQKINGQHHLPHICILDIKNKHLYHYVTVLAANFSSLGNMYMTIEQLIILLLLTIMANLSMLTIFL